MLGDGNLEFADIAPGEQAWIAQLASYFSIIDGAGVWKLQGTLGENANAGQAVSMGADGKLYLADSNGGFPKVNMIGLLLTTGNTNDPVRFVTQGLVAFAHAFTLGAVIYLSETPGGLTTVAPTTPRIVGLAYGSNKILLMPARSWAAA